MSESKMGGMEHQSSSGGAAVPDIPNNGMPDMGAVNPQLIGPPRNRCQLDERRVRASLNHPKNGSRGLTFGPHIPLRLLIGFPAERGIDSQFVGGNDAVDDRRVELLHLPAGELETKLPGGKCIPCNDHQTRRIAIEPVWEEYLAARHREQILERAFAFADGRMN